MQGMQGMQGMPFSLPPAFTFPAATPYSFANAHAAAVANPFLTAGINPLQGYLPLMQSMQGGQPTGAVHFAH